MVVSRPRRSGKLAASFRLLMNLPMSLRRAATGSRAGAFPLRLVAAAAIVAAVFAQATLPLRAQTLGELAQKEQERRKGVKAAGKVYSNKDLPKPPEPTPPAGADTVPPAATAPDAKTDAPKPEPKEEKDEAWWHARMMQAREAQRRGEAFAEALQSRINALSADAVNRDDPYQRAKAADDRQKAVAELGRVTSEIEQAKKEIVAIEEEARQGNVPPGWIR
jgi:hypothetical protein